MPLCSGVTPEDPMWCQGSAWAGRMQSKLLNTLQLLSLLSRNLFSEERNQHPE